MPRTEAISCTVQRLNPEREPEDRKSTRLNSSHLVISYAVFCLKKKKNSVIAFSQRPDTVRSSNVIRGSGNITTSHTNTPYASTHPTHGGRTHANEYQQICTPDG